MDTTARSWALTLGTVAVIGLISTGHAPLITDAVRNVIYIMWWLVLPIEVA